MFGVGVPTERELMCLARARLWDSLIPFALLFEEPEPKKKTAKPEYDWRVVVANQRRS
jgi:hypothetical protein